MLVATAPARAQTSAEAAATSEASPIAPPQAPSARTPPSTTPAVGPTLETPSARLPERNVTARKVGIGFAGAFTAFLAHELGHIGMNLALGNTPQIQGLLVWGFVPFFVVAPEIDCYGDTCTKRDGSKFHAGRTGKYAIVTAGFNVQHITDEVILSLAPDLRLKEAPFRKGMLLFNVFLSCFYAAGAWTGLEDPHGDLGGASRLSGIDEILLSFALLTPAALDTYRYFRPSSVKWAPWISRGAKAGFIGLNFMW